MVRTKITVAVYHQYGHREINMYFGVYEDEYASLLKDILHSEEHPLDVADQFFKGYLKSMIVDQWIR